MRNLAMAALALTLLAGGPASADGMREGGGRSAAPSPDGDLPCPCAAAFAEALAEAQAEGGTSEDDRIARDLASRDLAAQQSMDRSARDMVALTRLQLLLSLFSTLGLGGSLLFAWWALGHSRRELQESRDFQRSGLRAYVSVEKFEASLSASGEFLFNVGVWNRGQSTARDVLIASHAGLHDGGPRDATWQALHWASQGTRFGIIQPGARVSTYAECRVTPEDRALVERSTKVLLAQVEVYYRDIFGCWYRRRAMLAFYGPEIEFTDLPPDGNDEEPLPPDFVPPI